MLVGREGGVEGCAVLTLLKQSTSTLKFSEFYSQCMSVFIWVSEEAAIVCLISTNQLLFDTGSQHNYCTEETEILNIYYSQKMSDFHTLKFTHIHTVSIINLCGQCPWIFQKKVVLFPQPTIKCPSLLQRLSLFIYFYISSPLSFTLFSLHRLNVSQSHTSKPNLQEKHRDRLRITKRRVNFGS